MVFSSHIFLFAFLPLALLLYHATPQRGRALTLTLTSYVFYGWWNPWFVPLMLVSTLIDYGCGLVISAPEQTAARRKAAVVFSIVANLLILGFFKYALFFADSVGVFASWIGWAAPEPPDFLRHIVLPVGISFYTFQSMSYTIDLYRREAPPARNFIEFACYISMFPQLVAGPIVRYSTIADQLRSRPHTLDGFVEGVTRFCYGFAKKILLANPVGEVADACFGAGGAALDAPLAWVGIVAYALQIYFDFSGYSDMAIGLGRMMGFRLPENFDSPYRAGSITEFWRRWHMTLSTFLRDYLYIPLGGNRKGSVRTMVNLMLVMLIGGLWHGAQWTFVIWGGLHGLFLVVERLWRGSRLPLPPSWLSRCLTWVALLLTWTFFRAETLEGAWGYLRNLTGLATTDGSGRLLAEEILSPYPLTALVLGSIVALGLPNSRQFLELSRWWKTALGLALLVVSVRIMGIQDFNPFLYFQF